MLEITINNVIFLLQPFWLYFPHTLAVSPKTTNPYRNPSIPRENEWNTFFTNFITAVKFAIPMTFDDVSTKIARSMPPKRREKRQRQWDFIYRKTISCLYFFVFVIVLFVVVIVLRLPFFFFNFFLLVFLFLISCVYLFCFSLYFLWLSLTIQSLAI